MAEGAKITNFVFWPNFDLGRFLWGYAGWEGSTTWFTLAAPYFYDLLTFFAAMLIIREAKPKHRWLWVNILIIGMISPLVKSAGKCLEGLAGRQDSDVVRLPGSLDPTAVHLYFILTLLFYAWGIYYCWFCRKTWHPE